MNNLCVPSFTSAASYCVFNPDLLFSSSFFDGEIQKNYSIFFFRLPFLKLPPSHPYNVVSQLSNSDLLPIPHVAAARVPLATFLGRDEGF